ncbi:hypothetical protein SARC_03335 [Sphaeroforma arctica JP610]|uniref:Uncharacterized protein n=1 Tax=Sphaeroforma arctica JP610 TaxID=667725 RepID=A0A0L0G666_9EUKA|nr:hypothetical protein SARC_03335 [Sphaeroforma arctica JP610]KNC84439.1 hypothetical protein SARC_03335 [Sphaeroforma arctica JP610]|eukprot:XP_014158341.1 hypothetical protein SARC_03335 [Sphaeroforma arctica JP610]
MLDSLEQYALDLGQLCEDLPPISPRVDLQEVPLGTGDLVYGASLDPDVVQDMSDVTPRLHVRPVVQSTQIEYVISHHPSTDNPLYTHRPGKGVQEQVVS